MPTVSLPDNIYNQDSSISKSNNSLDANITTPLLIKNLDDDQSSCGINFNVLPNKNVEEKITVSKYIIKKRFIEAHFSREYKTDMINSPDHLIFLTSLVHLQKMIYIYLCYEFKFPIKISTKEKLKVWPTKIDIDMRNLITKKKDLTQTIAITSLKKTGPKSYFGKCVSYINGNEAKITADAVIYLI